MVKQIEKEMKKIILIFAIIFLGLSIRGQEYYMPYPDNSNDRIELVAIGRYVFITGKEYSYRFYNTNIELNYNRLYLISLAPKNRERVYNWAIWIDLNDDKDFEDPNELIYKTEEHGNVRGSLKIEGDYFGSTRMRVMMSEDSIAGSCDDFFKGEVKDYSVNFEKSTGMENTKNEPLFYPNPASNYVIFNGYFDQMLDYCGKAVDVLPDNYRIDISRLSNGIYFVKINDKWVKLIKQ